MHARTHTHAHTRARVHTRTRATARTTRTQGAALRAMAERGTTLVSFPIVMSPSPLLSAENMLYLSSRGGRLTAFLVVVPTFLRFVPLFSC